MLYVLSWSCSKESEVGEDDHVPSLRQVWILSFAKERIQEHATVKWRKVYSERNTSHRYSVGHLGKHQGIWAYEFLCVYMLSYVQFFVTPWTVVHQAPGILQARVLEWGATAGLDETQAVIKIARRNINNLRYAGGTTLMAESKKKLKNLLMKVKEESEKAGLKSTFKKLR